MPYTRPTLFGLAYTARLFRAVDYGANYDNFRQQVGSLDLTNEHHASLLLDWLNSWGCRIDRGTLPEFAAGVASWSQEWASCLSAIPLLNLPDAEMQVFGDAYESLRGAVMGSTATAKTLFALRPETAIPWDDAIRREFELADNGTGYLQMLRRSQQELSELVAETDRLGVPGTAIAQLIGSPDRTLARLLDEYHWITITRRYEIPTADELCQWLTWARGSGPAT